jgi:nickel-dependent lactate racemase
MSKQLHFGEAASVIYTPRGEVLHWEGPDAGPIGDLHAATAQALAEPIGFPPLRQAVVPGDKLVIALEPGVPQAASIVAAVVEAALEGGVSADDITILRVEGDTHSAELDPRVLLPDGVAKRVQLATHDPEAREDLSYVAADEHDLPIYMSRLVFDADVVVPIGCARLDESLGYGGVKATLYPVFADRAAQERCRAVTGNGHGRGNGRHGASTRPSRTAARRRNGAQRADSVSQREADRVASLLGAFFTVQVVPGRSQQVLHVLAGHIDEVLPRAQQLCREAWAVELPERAGLVVAAIDGNAAQQNWDNVGRAIAAAQRVVAEDGAIALCTELADAPGPGVRTVAAAENLEQAQRRLHKHNPADSPAAKQWAHAIRRNRIYLLSQLDEQQVEQIGAAHVSDTAELGRLIERTDSCVLLSCAQYVLPTTND